MNLPNKEFKNQEIVTFETTCKTNQNSMNEQTTENIRNRSNCNIIKEDNFRIQASSDIINFHRSNQSIKNIQIKLKNNKTLTKADKSNETVIKLPKK